MTYSFNLMNEVYTKLHRYNQVTFNFVEEGPGRGSEDIKKECDFSCFDFFFFFSVFLIDVMGGKITINLNTICHLLALLGAHHILHVSRIRVKRTVQKIKKIKKRHMHTGNELDAH